MGRRTKTLDPKPCGRCQRPQTKLIRARTGPDEPWTLVCDDCWPALRAAPGYQYGGLWRAAKRRY